MRKRVNRNRKYLRLSERAALPVAPATSEVLTVVQAASIDDFVERFTNVFALDCLDKVRVPFVQCIETQNTVSQDTNAWANAGV